jgi:predicted component of type VI protein secretion system
MVTAKRSSKSAPPKKAARPAVRPKGAPTSKTAAKKPAPKPSAAKRPAPSPKPAAVPPAPPTPPRSGDARRHILSLSFLRDGDEFLARLEMDSGQITEMKNRSLDQLLTLVAGELEDLLE